uniref:F-box domain-containing protein n=1 Tax=Glossina brevipalpis TaxID=37001 RepID=A0A1A9WM12_9MUSC
MDNENVCKPIDLEAHNSIYAPALEELSFNLNDLLGNLPCTHGDDDDNTTALCLPNEIWIMIFKRLSHGDLLQVNLVCKEWCQLARTTVLKRTSTLVINKQNVNDIYHLMEDSSLNYEKVMIDDLLDEFTNVEQAVLLKIFKHLGSNIVELTVYRLSTLSAINDVLPKLKELYLGKVRSKENVPVNFNKFSNLEGLLMPLYNQALLSSLNQMSRLRLEKLSLTLDCLHQGYFDLLSMCAQSLRWLQLSIPTKVNSTTLIRLQETFTKVSQLERLDICAVGNTECRRAILENLPKEAPLKALNFRLGEDHDLLELIVRKWSNSLECLTLTCHKLTRNSVEQLSFLSGRLRCLCLYSIRTGPKDLLHSIAPKINKTLTELKLNFPIPAVALFSVLIQRLPNLTTLYLLGHTSNITDEEIGYIFRYLTHLRKLSLPPCVGKNNIKYLCSKPNISNLKGLRTLASCLCPIRVLHIINVDFQFKDLSQLHLHDCNRNKRLTQMFLDIGRYLPALEVLWADMFDNNDVQKIRESCPRLRRAFQYRRMF